MEIVSTKRKSKEFHSGINAFMQGNIGLAKFFFDSAYSKGELAAGNQLGILYLLCSKEHKDHQLAFNYFQKVYAKENDYINTFYLGLCYKNG